MPASDVNFRQQKSALLRERLRNQSFSYADIGVFMQVDSIAGISVVSNTGDVHILFKTERYNFSKAYDALMKIKKKYGGYSREHDLDIVKDFLKVSRRYGIILY